MTDIERYMLIELLFKDFSKDLFPKETEAIQGLSRKLADETVVVNSFSKKKITGSIILIIIGVIDYLLLYDAGVIHIFTYLPYKQVVGIPILLIGILLTAYQYFSAREFYILNHEDMLFFGEKTTISSFQRLQFFYFKKSNVKHIHLGNSRIVYEIAVFFFSWILIWFFLREGYISISNYVYLGYPMLLKIGLTLIISFGCLLGVFLSWMIPVGRSQLKISTDDVYVELNFNELKPEDAEKISEILRLPKVPKMRITDREKVSRRLFIKSNENEPIGVLNYNLLWQYFYFIMGSILVIIGTIIQILDLEINFSLGMFVELLVIFLGLKSIIYGFSEHFYQKEYKEMPLSW
ncbi:MAG: hypothetical protein GF364_14220, partial [Candidatus Lokiarchaeota archaeon]|nr:hypothetical protein [Candidatus Lokiarchaeota archaeon]